MDQVLGEAIKHLLDQVEGVVEDLLLVQIDWGPHTPAVTNEPAAIDFQGTRWPVVFTNSELVLRRTLCGSPQGRAIVVLRGENDLRLPLDIRARAHGGLIYRLGLRQRLHALTGRDWPPEVDYAEWRPSVESRFDALVRAAGQAGLRWVMTRSELEQILVQAAFGLKVDGRKAPELLADLLSTQRKSPAPPTDLELSLLRGQFRLHQVAWAEVLAWAAEEAGGAEELVRTGLMMGAEQMARRLPNWGHLNRLRALLVNERQLPEREAVGAVIELATGTLANLHPATRQAIVKAAETALEEVLPADSYNPWFPSALEREIESLALSLAKRDAAALAQVARLHEHLFAAQQRDRLDVLDGMAALMVQWDAQSAQAGLLAAVADWAGWYAQAGARLDLHALKLMAQQARGIGLEKPVQRLLEAYWHWRDELNATFAQTFISGYEAALHDRGSGFFGTHRILDWVVRPWVQAGRRVLLLVVDGMPYAFFWHLLDQWAGQTPAVHVHQPQAALALLPSVTSVSRKGLFLNALPTDRLDDEEAYEGKARVTETEALQRAFPGKTAKLYNKGNLGNGQPLLDELQFNRADVVAVILNAIDEDVKSSTTTTRLPSLDDLGPLRSSVQAALGSNWVVILTADHGHTWHRIAKLRRGEIIPGGGERFAPVALEKDLAGDAIVTQDPHIVRLQEGKKVALLTAVGSYFGHNPRRGYHGGAALEEVVVPYAVLTFEAPARPTEQGGASVSGKPQLQVDGYDLGGIVLTLADGRMKSLNLPIVLSPAEVRLLQALARLSEANEAELKQALGTRRVAGPLATLRERLAAEGLDLIELKGSGAGGDIYRFRTEMLK